MSARRVARKFPACGRELRRGGQRPLKPKKKGMTIGHALLFGGGEEIRTLAPAKPTYRISNHATNP